MTSCASGSKCCYDFIDPRKESVAVLFSQKDILPDAPYKVNFNKRKAPCH